MNPSKSSKKGFPQSHPPKGGAPASAKPGLANFSFGAKSAAASSAPAPAGGKKDKKRKKPSRRQAMSGSVPVPAASAVPTAAKTEKAKKHKSSKMEVESDEDEEEVIEQDDGEEEEDEDDVDPEFDDEPAHGEVEEGEEGAEAETGEDSYVPFPSAQLGHSLAFTDSIEYDESMISTEFFQWLIAPLSIDSFLENYFEKRPFAIHRSQSGKGEIEFVTIEKPLLEYVGRPAKQEKKVGKDAQSQRPSAQVNRTIPAIEPMEEEDQKEKSKKSNKSDASSSSSSSKSSKSSDHYYSGWFGKREMFSYLSSSAHSIHYSRDIDITQYKNGKRLTLNPSGPGAATAKQVQDFLSAGCSVRFLCPQQFNDKLWRMLHLLDEFFGMQTGANSYLTPAKTQGFAPHYDDVDVFVLQTEGAKRWRIYANKTEAEILPNVSSRNFDQSELGECIMDVWLRAGDFLYAPRGAIHQCVASETEDSMHVTVSSCLNSSWADYLKILLTRALDVAREENIALRRVLPLNWRHYMGVQNSSSEDPEAAERREEFLDETMEHFASIGAGENVPFDAAADELALDFLHGRVPPFLNKAEKEGTFAAVLDKLANKKKGKDPVSKGAAAETSSSAAASTPSGLLKPTTLLRLVKPGIARISPVEDNSDDGEPMIRLHHIMENSRSYKGKPLASIDIHMALAPAVETILQSYPNYIQIQQLPPPQRDDEDEEREVEDPISAEEEEENRQADMAELINLVQALFESELLEITNDQSKFVEMDDQEDEEGDEDEDVESASSHSEHGSSEQEEEEIDEEDEQ